MYLKLFILVITLAGVLTMIFLLALPYILEVLFETYFEKKKGISVNHFWTAVARGALMILIGGMFFKLEWHDNWWEPALVSVAIHFALFNYTYNWITGRKWTYLRSKGIDAVLASLPLMARIFFQVVFLLACLYEYFDWERL
jgi:hypothetical protein